MVSRRLIVTAAVCGALSSARAAPKTEIKSECTVKLERLLEQADPKRPSPDVELEKARPDGISVFAVLPSNERQYKAVYGSKATYSSTAKAELDKSIARLQAVTGADITISTKGKSELERVLKNSKNKIAVIVGHNDDGMFRFLNGDEVPVTEIADQCSNSGSFCIFLTCEAERLLAGQRCSAGAECHITAQQATLALEAVLKPRRAASTNPISGKDLWGEIEKNINAQKHQAQVKYVVAGTGVIIALLVTIYALSNDDSKPVPKP